MVSRGGNQKLDYTGIMPVWTLAMGERLRIARQAMDLDQVQMAKDLGITQATLSKIESGRSQGSRSAVTLAHWIEVLGAHAGYVFNASGSSRYDELAIRTKYFLKRYNGQQNESDNLSYVNRRKKRLKIK